MRLIKLDPNTGYLSNWLWIPKTKIDVDSTKAALSFTFNDTYSGGVRIECLWKETVNHLLVPRALWNVSTLQCKVIDIRPSSYPQVDIRSKIKLDHRWRDIGGKHELLPTSDDVQKKSMDAMLATKNGILQLACGRGKTAVALDFIAVCQMPALIVLPDTNLIEQWTQAIDEMLIVPDGIGRIQAEIFDWQKPIVLTTYHTLGARAPILSEEVRRWFGVIVWDEGHHVPAPTFAASAEAFYGHRISLTATPERDDGLHIISEFHIGPVLYKDLTQDLKPMIYFKWTGLEVDLIKDKSSLLDCNGELHLGKLSGFFGQWMDRIKLILDDVAEAIRCGRRVLILSSSVGEIVNMAALWTSGQWTQKNIQLFTDIPIPTPQDVGEILNPLELTVAQRKSLEDTVESLAAAPPSFNINQRVIQLKTTLQQNDIYKKISAEFEKRQRKYIEALLPTLNTCGIMTYRIPAKLRHEYVSTKPVVFAIMKYGKEGLDSPALDTVLVSAPFSSRNSLQQLMGRPCRAHDGKKSPIVVFYEDNISILIGMCQKLKKHLRGWPHDEGGPFSYELVNYPRMEKTWNRKIFGP